MDKVLRIFIIAVVIISALLMVSYMVLDSAHAAGTITLTAVSNIVNTGDLTLDAPKQITTFTIGSDTYLAVTAWGDDGVQILNVTNPANITAAGNIINSGIVYLDGAYGIDTFTSGSNTYVIIAASNDDGVQILDVTNPDSIRTGDRVNDNVATVNLNQPYEVKTFKIGSKTYAVAAAQDNRALQVLDITDPDNISATATITDSGGGDKELNGVRGVTSYKVGSNTYVAAASIIDNGVQIVRITDTGGIVIVSSIDDGDATDLELDGAEGITTFTIGSNTYVAVAAYNDDGVQILNVTDSANVAAVDSITDTGTLELDGARGIHAFTSGTDTYLAVGAVDDNGVQILNVTDPANIDAVANIDDTTELKLDQASDITSFTSGGDTYLAVVASLRAVSGVQILKVDGLSSSSPPPDTTKPVITLIGDATVSHTIGINYDDAGATCTDNVDNTKPARVSFGFSIARPGTNSVTFSCTDAAGNVADTVTRTVNVVDNAKPIIILTGAATVTLTVGTSYIDEGADCTDNYDSTKVATGTSTVNATAVGNYTVTYSCSDTAGNSADAVIRTVKVVLEPDTTEPVMRMAGMRSVMVTVGTSYDDAGATCTDNIDGDITPTSVNTVDITTVGTYSVTFSCSDTAGNSAMVKPTRRVNVVDDVRPVINLTGVATVDVTVGTSYTDEGATCTDNYDGNITPGNFSSVSIDNIGIYRVSYSCDDAAGNSAQFVSRIVRVVAAASDNVDTPVITINGLNPTHVIKGEAYIDDLATCTDNVDPVKTIHGTSIVNINMTGNYTVTYDCTDTAGNAATQALRIVIMHPEHENTKFGIRELEFLGITDDATLYLGAPNRSIIFTDDVYTYAAVASGTDSGIQIINITKEYPDEEFPNVFLLNTIPVGNINATAAPLLDGVTDMVLVTIDSNPYIAATALKDYGEDGKVYGIQLLDISDPGNVTAAGNITDSKSLSLDGASKLVSFSTDTNTYLAVAIYEFDSAGSVQILDVSNPGNITAAGNIVTTSTILLDDINDMVLVTIDSNPYIAVTGAYIDPQGDIDDEVRGVQLLNITDPDNITTAGNIAEDAIATFDKATTITSFSIDTHTYLAVATPNFDEDVYSDGVQILNISNPDSITAAGSITDTASMHLGNIQDIISFSYSDNTYLAVISIRSGGMEILDVSDPENVIKAGSTRHSYVDPFHFISGLSDMQSLVIDEFQYFMITAKREDRVLFMSVRDTTPPVMTLIGNSTVTHPVNYEYFHEGATCSDSFDGPLFTSTVITQNSIDVDFRLPGTYHVVYSCTDPAGNAAPQLTRTVEVVDDIRPTVDITGANPVVIHVGTTFNDTDVFCNDNVDSISLLTGVGNLDVHTVGDYTLTYSCTDTSGNMAINATRTVKVVDVTVPIIYITGDNPLRHPVNTDYDDAGAECRDDVDGISILTGTGTVNAGSIGTYTITYSCTDDANNQAVPVLRTVNVVDVTPPTIRIIGDNPLRHPVNTSYSDAGARCEDDVDATKPATSTGTVNAGSIGTYTLTYSCTDDADHDAIDVIRTVEVYDNIFPVIDITGSDSVRVTVGTTYDDMGATCHDNIDGPLTPTSVSTVDTETIGTYSVTYSCQDSEGNPAIQELRTVDVVAVVSKSSATTTTLGDVITIDGHDYQIDGRTITIKPHVVTVGQYTDIVLTADSADDIIHFTAYLNLHGNDVGYSASDTYVRYDHGTVEIRDTHGFISDATVTVTEDDTDLPDIKTIHMTIQFEDAMGLTNMVLYMWNDDRGSARINVLDAIDVISEPEPVQEPDPEPQIEPDPEPQIEPEHEPKNISDDAGTQTEKYDTDPLLVIRMWAGFEYETVTDDVMLQALNLDYPGADIPNWVMTDLGVLVSKGYVTINEFETAITYVLDNII